MAPPIVVKKVREDGLAKGEQAPTKYNPHNSFHAHELKVVPTLSREDEIRIHQYKQGILTTVAVGFVLGWGIAAGNKIEKAFSPVPKENKKSAQEGTFQAIVKAIGYTCLSEIAVCTAIHSIGGTVGVNILTGFLCSLPLATLGWWTKKCLDNRREIKHKEQQEKLQAQGTELARSQSILKYKKNEEVNRHNFTMENLLIDEEVLKAEQVRWIQEMMTLEREQQALLGKRGIFSIFNRKKTSSFLADSLSLEEGERIEIGTIPLLENKRESSRLPATRRK